MCGREFPVAGEFYTSWSAMGDRLNGNSNDYFGESMSFNRVGDVVVVGIPDTGSNKGEIKAYRWDGSTWTQAGNTIEGPTNSGYFGRAVDINGTGDIIIVGGKDDDKYGTKRGLVRTYRLTKNYRNDGQWIQFGEDIYGGSNYTYTGSAVAIDNAGYTIAVASYQESAGSYTYNGVVRIYELDSNSHWILQTSLNGTTSYQYTGQHPQSLSFNHDATVLAVGAHSRNPNNTSNSGEVRIYKYSGSSWSLSKSFYGGSNVYRGWAVSLNKKGDIVIFCEPYYSNYMGQVQIYRNTTGTTWQQLGSILRPSGYYYSYLNSVDINDEGNIIAIGGYGDTINSYDSGSVWVYKWSNGTNFTSGSWSLLGSRFDGGHYDSIGNIVSLNDFGNRIAFSSKNIQNSNHGEVQMHSIGEIEYNTLHVTISDDISGNDASFNNVDIESLNVSSLKLPVVSTAPSDAPSVGAMKFNTGDNKLYIYTGSTDGWKSYSPD